MLPVLTICFVFDYDVTIIVFYNGVSCFSKLGKWAYDQIYGLVMWHLAVPPSFRFVFKAFLTMLPRTPHNNSIYFSFTHSAILNKAIHLPETLSLLDALHFPPLMNASLLDFNIRLS